MSWPLLFVLLSSAILPLLIAIGGLSLYRWWQDRAGRRSPIENKVIFSPAEQLRVRIEALDERMAHGLIVLIFIGPYFVAAWLLSRIDPSKLALRWGDLIYLSAFLMGCAWAIRSIVTAGNLRRRARAGLKAELFTANELNRLLASGCTVLLDVPGDGFNIDHVVIGPRAVYAVETKSVRKPRKSDGGDHFKVRYDGTALHFPDFVNKTVLGQAQRQAQWLSRYVSQAVNSNVPVLPTVALPGWWIESEKGMPMDTVRVFNPAGKGGAFMADDRGQRQIRPELQALITQALVMRYPASAA
jgi:hypothetical protein